MKKQYTHVTAAISPEGLEEFEKKLQKIKNHYGNQPRQILRAADRRLKPAV